MGERNFGARWWRESLGIARWASRPAVGTMGLLGALSLAGCATTWGGREQLEETQLADAGDELNVNVDALQLQRDEGWDVGQPGATLAFPDSTTEDAAGGQSWREAMTNLAGTLAPSAAALQPFYVPTLFQSLIGPAGQRLRAVMRPIHNAGMDDDFARGIALRAQFAGAEWPKDTALVVDAPGPRAVAVAAALADRFAPVFTFANWPHPLGVVPAHQTIAASLYYLPIFSAAAAVRAADAPPLFVLDANRLAHYGDADKQFDNRYFVHLPRAEQLAALGIRHLLYVGAGDRELDDLNAALVALCQKGVDVKMVALGDFVRAGDEPQVAAAEGDSGGDGDEEGDEPEAAPVDPAWTFAFAWAQPLYLWPHFWYRGCWWDRSLFWSDYNWYAPSHGGPMIPRHGRGAVVIGPPTGVRTPAMPSHAVWTPSMRNTMFTPAPSNAHVGPSLGQIAVTASRNDGHIIGFRGGATTMGPPPGRIGVGIAGAGTAPIYHRNGGVFGQGFNGSLGRGGSGGGLHPTYGGAGGFHSSSTAGFSGRAGSIGRAGTRGFGGGGLLADEGGGRID
ncbi:MAG: hypothetical protein JWM53_4608, partial [bacterium]|nr:hypothetical protein [bacterium]